MDDQNWINGKLVKLEAKNVAAVRAASDEVEKLNFVEAVVVDDWDMQDRTFSIFVQIKQQDPVHSASFHTLITGTLQGISNRINGVYRKAGMSSRVLESPHPVRNVWGELLGYNDVFIHFDVVV